MNFEKILYKIPTKPRPHLLRPYKPPRTLVPGNYTMYFVYIYPSRAVYFFAAQIMRSRGRIHEALTLFQAATCLNPQNVCNIKQVGRCLSLLGKHKAALDVFEEANKVSREPVAV